MKATATTVDDLWPALLAAARGGDRRAMGEVCERLRQYLLLWADRGLAADLRAKLGASDLVQQSLLEAQSGFDRFTGGSEAELRMWLVRILEHNLIDAARRYRRSGARNLTCEVPLVDRHQTSRLVQDQRTASSLLRCRETDEALLRAVAALPERRRRVVELRHRDGMSYASIGRQMGITEAAARKLWSRALEDLRASLTGIDGS